jgi:hypothetical protein
MWRHEANGFPTGPCMRRRRGNCLQHVRKVKRFPSEKSYQRYFNYDSTWRRNGRALMLKRWGQMTKTVVLYHDLATVVSPVTTINMITWRLGSDNTITKQPFATDAPAPAPVDRVVRCQSRLEARKCQHDANTTHRTWVRMTIYVSSSILTWRPPRSQNYFVFSRL